MGILKDGLDISKYPTIQETTKYKGELDPGKTEMIVNHDFSWPVPEQIIVMIAIPKNIKINNEDINLSVPEYKYGDYSYGGRDPKSGRSQYTQLYDLCEFHYIHKAFTLGAIVTHQPDESKLDFYKRGGKYELFKNTEFFGFLPQERQNAVMDEIAKKHVAYAIFHLFTMCIKLKTKSQAPTNEKMLLIDMLLVMN